MSYCRLGLDSDVYLWFNGLRFCFIAVKKDQPYTAQEFTVLGLELAIAQLSRLRSEGYRFPESAMERLLKEHRELLEEARSGEY